MKQKFTELIDKLASEGGPDAIALFLQSQGVKGLVGDGFHCPLATYLKRETGACEVGVGQSGAYLYSETAAEPCTSAVSFIVDGEQVEKYAPISNFVDAFDGKKYPHLIKGSAS